MIASRAYSQHFLYAPLLVPFSLGKLSLDHNLCHCLIQGLGRCLTRKISLCALLAPSSWWKGILSRGIVFAIDHDGGSAIRDCFFCTPHTLPSTSAPPLACPNNGSCD